MVNERADIAIDEIEAGLNSLRWIQLPDYFNGDYVVHEVKCPVCHYHETYTDDAQPEDCYICGRKRGGVY